MKNLILEDEKNRILILRENTDRLDNDGIPSKSLIFLKRIDDADPRVFDLSYEDGKALCSAIQSMDNKPRF